MQPITTNFRDIACKGVQPDNHTLKERVSRSVEIAEHLFNRFWALRIAPVEVAVVRSANERVGHPVTR